MKRIRALLFFSLIIVIGIQGFAQSGAQFDFAPLQPQAAELYRHASNHVSALTGAVDITIPLFSDETEPAVNLSLNYNASGIKVNQVSSWVGLGWLLNASGAISRTVRGLPDETESGEGWISDPTTAAQLANSLTYEVRKRYADLEKDGSPDYFHLSLPGKSLTFIYRKSLQRFEALTQEPIKIEWIDSSIQERSKFRVTDEHGKQYIFDRRDAIVNESGPTDVPRPLRYYNQTWHMTAIVAANKVDTIKFSYERQNASAYLSSRTDSRTYADNSFYLGGRTSGYVPNFVNAGVVSADNLYDYNESLVSEIKYKNKRLVFSARTVRKDFGRQLDSIVVFENNKRLYKYEFNYGYFEASAKPIWSSEFRLKLLSIKKISAKPDSQSEVHTFSYSAERLPSTNSAAQDYWGYYNGRLGNAGLLPNVKPIHGSLLSHSTNIGYADRKPNAGYMQAGMLKSVIYPSGAIKEYIYESHKYLSEVSRTTQVPVMPSFKIIANSMIDPVVYRSTFVVPAGLENNGRCRLLIEMSPHRGGGPFSLDDVQYITIRNVTQNRDIATFNHTTDFYNPRNIDVEIYMREGDLHEVFATVRSEPSLSSPVSLSGRLFGYKTTVSQEENDGGGLRIRQINDFESNGILSTQERFTYPLGKFLRGDKDFESNFIEKSEFITDPSCAATLPCYNCWVPARTITYVASGVLPMVTLEGSSVLYSQVTKEILDRSGAPLGKIEYFRSYLEMGQNTIYNPNVPTGREYITNLIFASQEPSAYYYAYDTTLRNFRLVRTKTYEYEPLFISSEPITSMFRRKFYNNSTCTTTGTVFDPADFSHISYDIKFGFFNMKSQIVREFDSQGDKIIENSTVFYRDNKLHRQVNRVENKRSDGKSVIEYFTYPDDYASGLLSIDQMKHDRSHLVALPIETVKVVEEGTSVHVLSGEVSSYVAGGKGFRDFIHTLQNVDKIPISSFKFSNKALGVYPVSGSFSFFEIDSRYKLRWSFPIFDIYGNPLEVTRSNTSPVAYLWGYSGQYPVAKIENATYAEVQGILTAIEINSLNAASVSEATVQTIVAKLRNHANMRKAQVSTYTYKPLVGMTSMTDPRGVTEYYQFDGFQRLKDVLDFDKNILRTFRYNYRP